MKGSTQPSMDLSSSRSDDGDKPIGKSSLGIWRHLISEQTELFSNTVAENERLVLRNRELERELSVWKQALTKADADQGELQRSAAALNLQVSDLQQQLRSLHEDNPLILTLVDGDGNIFADELLRQGRIGGRAAAALLSKGITACTANVNTRIASRARIWVSVYCNKDGLSDTLVKSNICTSDDFENFCLGFNQAGPLFNIIDVGYGKEAADAKIKEYLRVFAPFPQTALIYFGGGHDNGYSTTLSALETEGLLHKIVLLCGYTELALELQHLGLVTLQIDGLFRPTKVPSSTKQKTFKRSPDGNQITDHNITSPAGRKLQPNVPLNKHTPPPCTFFYLARCEKGSKCSFGHDYDVTPENLEEMRRASKKFPCVYINKGKPCLMEENCFSGHYCPNGKNCVFVKVGKCRFLQNEMHSKDVTAKHTKETKSVQQRSQSKSSISSTPVNGDFGYMTAFIVETTKEFE